MSKIKGTKFADRLKGLVDDDTIIGLKGSDHLLGGAGADSMSGGGGNDTIFGGGGNDSLVDGGGADRLKGGAGDDVLDGGGGKDFLSGGIGNDLLIGGKGADRFSGGGGIDTVDFSGDAGPIVADLSAAFAKKGAKGDTFTGIENLLGGAAGDRLVGDDGNNRLAGNDGNDVLIGNAGSDRLEGGAGNDRLDGGAGNDRLDGGAGNDLLDGGAGDDLLFGGAGADHFVGGAGFDLVSYQGESAGVAIDLGNGIARAAAAGDSFAFIEGLVGSNFGDEIVGSNSNDTLRGGGGNDGLMGRGGFDIVDGQAGDDILLDEGDGKADRYIGGSGSDWIDYSGSSTAVDVELARGLSSGGAKGDTYDEIENVKGSRGADFLQAALNGRAYGHDGDDVIIDSFGTEVLRGGKGRDILIGDNPSDSADIFFLEAGKGADVVEGFQDGLDLFWLSSREFGALDFDAAGRLASGQVLNSASPAATTNAAQLIYETDESALWYDADGTGSGSAVEVAHLVGVETVATSDFLVVPDI